MQNWLPMSAVCDHFHTFDLRSWTVLSRRQLLFRCAILSQPTESRTVVSKIVCDCLTVALPCFLCSSSDRIYSILWIACRDTFWPVVYPTCLQRLPLPIKIGDFPWSHPSLSCPWSLIRNKRISIRLILRRFRLVSIEFTGPVSTYW